MENLDNYPANAGPRSDRAKNRRRHRRLRPAFIFGPRGLRGPVPVTELGQLLEYRVLPGSLCGRN